MKSKLLTYSALTLSFLTLALPASASLSRLESRQEKMEVRYATAEAKRTERKEERQETRSDIAEKHAKRLEERFNAYYTRLSSILAKIQARVDALTDKDTTTAKAKLSQAKTKLEEAKTLADKAITLFKAIDPAKWSEQRAQAVTARDTANQARKAFMATHALMVEAVRSLKSLNAK